MKLNYKSQDGRFEASFEGNEKEVFKQVAHFQEVFENKCVIDGDVVDDVKLVVRNVEDNEFFEMRVASGKYAGHKLEFGANKKGDTLFPKRKDKDGNWLKNNGWTKWEKDSK